MAWIYFQGLVGSACLSETLSDQLHIVKTTDFVRASYCLECNQVSLVKLQYGTMCELSKKNCCQSQFILSTADFHVRTSALLALEKAWTESEADFIGKFIDSFLKYVPRLFSSKTSQQLEPAALKELSGHFPNSGMTVDGRLFQPQKLAPATLENDGFYLPTMTASDYGKNNGRNSKDPTKSRDRWSVTVRSSRGELPGHPKGRLHPEWVEQAMGYRIGWTDIEPSVIPWFQLKQEKRLRNL